MVLLVHALANAMAVWHSCLTIKYMIENAMQLRVAPVIAETCLESHRPFLT